MTSTLTPRIYVACLASYNAGTLHGAWIDAAQDSDAIREEVAAMLRTSPHPNVTVACPDCDGPLAVSDLADPAFAVADRCKTCKGSGRVPSAEEYAIHDHEDFGGFEVGESMPLDEVSKLATAIEEHGEAFALYAGDVGLEYALEHFEEAYRGAWDDEEAYAESCAELLGEIPAPLAGYIDWAKFARDLFIGDVSGERGSDGMLHVFDRNV